MRLGLLFGNIEVRVGEVVGGVGKVGEVGKAAGEAGVVDESGRLNLRVTRWNKWRRVVLLVAVGEGRPWRS